MASSITGMNTVDMPRKEFFDVDNYPAVYAHTRETWQDQEQAEKYHRILGRILAPHVYFAPGVEDRMEQEVENGAQCAIAFTHGSMLDPIQIAATAERNRSFDQLIGRTMIGAKVGLFTAPWIGERVPDLGALPVYRKKDVRDKKQSQEEQDRREAIRVEAGQEFINTKIIGMNQGLHVAMHVEGTRNRPNRLVAVKNAIKTVAGIETEDPRKTILPLRDGYGNVVCGVNDDVDVLMMTGAFWYGSVVDLSKNWRRPTIYLDILKDQRRTDPKAVTGVLSPTLQHTLDQAILLHGRR
jgi:1-acyl-sn-glycerol-3-phosphate acyltransferase